MTTHNHTNRNSNKSTKGNSGMPLINLQHGVINKSNLRATEAYPESLSGRISGETYASQQRFFGHEISLNRKQPKSNPRHSQQKNYVAAPAILKTARSTVEHLELNL